MSYKGVRVHMMVMHVWALIPDEMINQDIKDSKAYKTYLDFAIGKATPKKARKFKKVASPSKKLSPVLEEEPAVKPKRAKKPAKKSTTVPTIDVVIRDTPSEFVPKKKTPAKVDRGKGMDLLFNVALLQAAQLKKTLKKSKLETHKLHASGSGDGVGSQPKVPDEQENMTTGTDKGTGTKPRVPDVPKYLSKSENESWGDSGDDDSNDDDSDEVTKDDDDNDVESDVDGDKEASNSEKTDSDEDENPNLNQNDYEEEEYEEEYVRTPNSFEFTKDDEEYEELYNNVNVRLKDTEHEEEGKRDEEMSNAGRDDGTQQSRMINIVSALEKELSQLKQTDYSTQLLKMIKSQILAMVDAQLSKRLKDSIKKAFRSYTAEFEKKAKDERKRYIDLVENSVKDIIKDQVKSQLPPILSKETWVSNIAKAEKSPLTFDELMSTLIDFSAYIMNNLKIENLTQEHLAVTDRLDWNNPEGQEYPFELSKPLPLIKDRGRQVVHVNYFINNDLEYLKGGSSSKKYTTSTTKIKTAKYHDIKGIKDMVSSLWSPVNVAYDKYVVWGITHWGLKRQRCNGYGSNRESKHDILVRREDQQLYKFKEGNFPRLNLRDIEDMQLLLFQKKLFILERDVIYNLNVALHMLTKHVVILKRVEDLQLGVESYQKKLNITNPETFRFEITNINLYPTYNNP
nr:hypothetical protein [Tanacetum cinerariifolium]